MASPLDRPALWALGAALASGAMLAFAFSVQPIAWLAWIALVPLLWLVPRVRPRTALWAAALAWTIGQSRIWWYLSDSVEMPPVFILVSGLFTTALYTTVICLYRRLITKDRNWFAFVSVPTGLIATEYAVSILNADAGGEWWSLAYTQADTPFLQVVSLTGFWGLTFLLGAVPAAIAVATAPGSTIATRAGIGTLAAACLAGALVFGLVRPEPTSDTIRAGALALPADQDSIRVDTPEAAALFADYQTEILRLGSEADLDVLVLSEKIFNIRETETAAYLEQWSDLAAASGIDLVLGLALEEGAEVYNAAVWIPADGTEQAVYRKQHLIPGLEDWMTASDTGPVTVPGTDDRWAMTICKDLDHAATIAEYGEAGTGLMLAPALDFTVDRWWHSRIALTRSAEQGFAMVRAGQIGYLTVSDQHGRILAQDERLAIAEVPTGHVDTVYTRFGNWFLWTALAALAGAALVAFVPRRQGKAQTEPVKETAAV